ncbi:MAG: outer membrane protein assembly factor BamD [Ferruginibacter sp.]
MTFVKVFTGIILSFLLFTGCSKFSKVQKSKDFEYQLKMADQYYAQKKYHNAQVLYEQLFAAYKGTDKFEDLYYKYAYTFYYQDLYRDAENLFKGYLEVFPNSSRAEEIDYMRAYSFYKQSPRLELEQVNTVKAMNMMQTFINTHPGSPRIKDASDIIDKSRQKLEMKEYRSAKLFYDLGHFRAAAISFTNLLNNYPDARIADEYELMVIKSYYKFAKLSINTKQVERYESVIDSFEDFADRFPDSPLLAEATSYSELSKNHIKEIQNEQASSTVK